MAGVHTLKKKYIVLTATVAIVLFLDIMTKAYIASTMLLHESFDVIRGFFSITYIRNPGAAFGFLAGAPPIFRSIFFLSITVIVVALILYYISKSRVEETFGHFPMSLILAGALGNMIDRVRFGEVIDFLDVYIGTHHWPAFNVADSAISVGVVLLAVSLLRQGDESVSSAGKAGSDQKQSL
jgi:signal peptidase II